MPDNKVHSGKTPGFLAKLRKIFGLNIGTVMFGAIFIYMIFSVILILQLLIWNLIRFPPVRYP